MVINQGIFGYLMSRLGQNEMEAVTGRWPMILSAAKPMWKPKVKTGGGYHYLGKLDKRRTSITKGHEF
jgi:hypothetical protein